MESTIQPDIVQNILPIQIFFSEWNVRIAWIAFTTLWVFWGFIWFIRNAFGGDGTHVVQPAIQTDPNVSTTDPNVLATPKQKFLPAPAWSNQVNRAHNMLRDLILILISVLVINSFARGSTRAVAILAWIFIAFGFICYFVEAAFESRFLRLGYTLIFFAIGLAIIGCAWHDGFYV